MATQIRIDTDSIACNLYHSRRWIDGQGFVYSGPVVDLVRQIEETAKGLGLTLSRWQANKGNHATTITYAVHSGERANQARHQRDIKFQVTLTAMEGSTKRCAAYAALSGLLADLESVQEAS